MEIEAYLQRCGHFHRKGSCAVAHCMLFNVCASKQCQTLSCRAAGPRCDCHALFLLPCRLYVPDWSGNLWCLDAITGSIIWQRTIADLVYSVDPNPYPHTPNKTIISRTSPAVAGNLLVSPAGCLCINGQVVVTSTAAAHVLETL